MTTLAAALGPFGVSMGQVPGESPSVEASPGQTYELFLPAHNRGGPCKGVRLEFDGSSLESGLVTVTRVVVRNQLRQRAVAEAPKSAARFEDFEVGAYVRETEGWTEEDRRIEAAREFFFDITLTFERVGQGELRLWLGSEAGAATARLSRLKVVSTGWQG
jgi:hypothetical protein